MAACVVGFFVIGAGSIILGASRIYPPAAWIVFGLFYLFVAVWPVVRRS